MENLQRRISAANVTVQRVLNDNQTPDNVNHSMHCCHFTFTNTLVSLMDLLHFLCIYFNGLTIQGRGPSLTSATTCCDECVPLILFFKTKACSSWSVEKATPARRRWEILLRPLGCRSTGCYKEFIVLQGATKNLLFHRVLQRMYRSTGC